MATSQVSGFIHHLRRTLLLQDGAGLTDGQLLTDYISRHDEAALAALVHRHGPMVWGVCRRVLRHFHDAEDAFQATFLVLVRKAASIESRELLANWLYGVAHQTALNARATAAKRKGRERQVAQVPEPAVAEQEIWRDLHPLLDEELSRLPAMYRAVVVLCDLEGKSRKEVARQLDCPEGTVAGRLARARVMLARRLTQRGIALSGGALAVVLSQKVVSAGVPALVLSNTIKAAGLLAAGQAAASGLITAKVAALTEGVLKDMFVTKIKQALAVVLVIGLTLGGIGTGVGLFTHPVAVAQQPPANLDDVRRAETQLLQAKLVVKQAEKTLELAKLNQEHARKQLELIKNRLEQVKGRKESLDGEWKLIAKEHEGKRESYPQGVGVTLLLDANKFILVTQALNPMGGGRNSGMMSETFYRHNPMDKTFDLVFPAPPKGQARRLGIYKVEQDRLTICWGKAPEDDGAASDRPNEFSTKPGSGRTLNVFERSKPEIATAKQGPAQPIRGDGPFKLSDAIKVANQSAAVVTVETVRGKAITTQEGTVYEVDAKTKYAKRTKGGEVKAKHDDLKPGATIEVQMDKRAKVVKKIVILDADAQN